MALTEAQVQQYYETILQRPATDAQVAVAVATGQSAGDLINALIGSSEAASFVFPVLQVYQAVFGRVPDAAGLDFWVDAYRAGTSLEAITAGFVDSDEFRGMYGEDLTDGSDPAFIQQLYINVLGREGEPAGIAFWTSPDKAGINPADVVRLFAMDAEFTNKAAAPIAQFLADAANGIEGVYEGSLFEDGTIGDTFTLTNGVDAGVAFVGTADNDTYDAILATNPANGLAQIETLGTLDALDGGLGQDTLNYYTDDGVALPAATIRNIETLNIVSGAGVTADVSGSNISGLTTLTAKATAGAVDIDTKSNVTSISVTGTAAGVDIDDAGSAATTADKLASVSLNGNTAAATIDSDALTSLSLANTNQSATVTAAAGTRELELTLDNVTGGTIGDATATSVVVDAVNKKSSGTTLTANNASTITFTGDQAVSTALGAQKAGLAITSTNTAGTTITTALNTDVSFTGGAGKDAVTVAATTKAINMGAGDDTVTMSVAVGSGGTVDGGEGKDTLAMAAADAATVSATTTFENGISNFEVLKLGATAAAAIVDLANIDDINYVQSAGTAATFALTLNNFTSGGTLELNGVAAAGITANVKNAGASTSDVFNIVLNGASNLINTAAVTVANVETINVTTTDSTDASNPAAASTVMLNAADATSITVAGNHGVDFTGSTLTKVTNLDASGVVGTGATPAAAATAGTVTFSTVVTDKAVTIKGGNGNDALSAASLTDATAKASATIDGGAGNDTITGGNFSDTLSGGEGNDIITGGLGADTLSGGAGNDTFVYNLVSDSTLLNLDVITDFQANTYGNGAGGATGTGAGAVASSHTGDVLQFTVTAAVKAVGVVASVQSNASDAQTFLQNLAADATIDQFGAALDSSTGRLYIDLDANGTVDSVIQLTGVSTIDAAAFVLV